LQAALFTVGSTCWFVSEVLLHAHVPEWTAVLGWSLLLTNLLSLPLMNLSGVLAATAARTPAVLFHDYGGTLITVGWLFAFWFAAQHWMLAD
jgi:hypothetical protein